ncbi:MAG: sugar phosphate isomerase/epimerase [Clostridia bacterium]|nr:sugar phosphate isomerase/epimerase [Clostridia bacterium]
MLKTGIYSSAYFDLTNYEDGLKKMRAHGYQCVDLQWFISPSSPFYTMDKPEFISCFKALKSAADKTGISVWQTHGLMPPDDSTEESRKDVLSRQEKVIIAAGILGCKFVVIHPAIPFGWGEEPSRETAFEITAERFYNLLPTASSEGVTLCVENMPFGKGHSFSEIGDVKRLVTEINAYNLKICFDTGHCNVTGEDHYAAIKTLGKDLACLHVHDDAARQDRHLVPYQGEIDWEKVIKGLKEIGFDGCISLETGDFTKMPEPMREEMRISVAKISRYIADKVGG